MKTKDKLTPSDRLWVAALLRDDDLRGLAPAVLMHTLKKQGFPVRIIRAVMAGSK